MAIDIATKPNALDTYRYDVRVRRSESHGYRRTPGLAAEAAREDQSLMYLCARVETEEPEAETGKPRVRQERRERHTRED